MKKYKWLLSSLIFTLSMLLFRAVLSKSIDMYFLIWNLFLAFIPLWLSYQLHRFSGNKFKAISLFAMWLLFFPNAMYIVTDLFHLNNNTNIPKWFDLLLLFSAALNGLFMGMVSLRNVEKWLRVAVPVKYLNVVLFSLFVLCGYGIYLGRYVRWNSWDIFVNPHLIAYGVYQDIVHPFRHNQTWAITLLFATWMYILYGYYKKIHPLKNAGVSKIY